MHEYGQDKAVLNHYRLADSPAKSCNSCTRKHAVPYMWCDDIGRSARREYVCDVHEVIARRPQE